MSGLIVPRTAERQRTSEERCARAFQAWADLGNEFRGRPIYRLIAWNAWQACWRHMEQLREEWVKS